MSGFWDVLGFAWIPFAGAAIFSLTAAPLGAALSLRDEILLGLALPPVGTAAVVTVVFFGVDPEATLSLYLAAAGAILALSLLLPRRRGVAGASPRWRAALLAAIFCAAQAATLLLSAGSPRVEAHVQHTLRGELLAIGLTGLLVFAALTLVVLSLGFRYRGMIYALALDEEGLSIKLGGRGLHVLLVFRVLAAVLIAAGVIWVGPLLTLGLIAIPTMLWERRARGLGALFGGTMLIALSAVILGFAASIATDLPPVPVVIAALLAVGGAIITLARAS